MSTMSTYRDVKIIEQAFYTFANPINVQSGIVPFFVEMF